MFDVSVCIGGNFILNSYHVYKTFLESEVYNGEVSLYSWLYYDQ